MPVTANPLAHRIARDLMDAIREGRIGPGEHLSAQKLADRYDVSRSPVREALMALEGQGVVEQLPNRGFFARAVATAPKDGNGDARPFEDANAYQAMAEDWLTDRIPAEVTEQLLRERYQLTKAQLTDLLVRATREGWIERKQGYGWRFLPVAKTPDAFEQIYRFRMAVEPAAMLEPTYAIDPQVLAEHRRIQQRMLDHDIEHGPAERLLDHGTRFHEDLIRFSGNPFFHQALVRVNRMRRLMEYRSRVDRRRLYGQCAQHLELIDLLERGEVVEASYLMRRHLSGALATKSPVMLPGEMALGTPSE